MGDAGSDIFDVRGSGNADGGGGTNSVTFSRLRQGVTASLGSGRASFAGGKVRFVRVRVLVGSRGADTLNGSGKNDYIDGLKGKDRLRGLGGDDLLIGGNGFDRGDGGPGGDVCVTEVKVGCEA